jgi:hypothetical protein
MYILGIQKIFFTMNKIIQKMQVDGALLYTQMLLGIDETANSEYYNDYLQRPASYEVKQNRSC